MHGLAKLLVGTTAFVILASVAAVLVVPPSAKERLMQRQLEAERLIDRVSEAVWRFQRERGVFPAGNGTGSEKLVRALSRASRTGEPYLRLRADEVTGLGHLCNPVAPETDIVYYQNNSIGAGKTLGGRNPGAFDLWCRDAGGMTDGTNNWGGRVPFP